MKRRSPSTGDVDWAGTGDAYFAMAAIPAQKMQRSRISRSKYEVETDRFLTELSVG